MYGAPKLVQDSTVKHPPDADAEPRLDWANRLLSDVHEHVLQCALGHVRNREVAEDLAQAIVAQLWIDHGEDMRWYDEEQLKAFLGTLVRRRIIDLRRRAQTRETCEAEYQKFMEQNPSACEASPERALAERELDERVDQVVNELSPAAQEIYRLYLDGLLHKDIAGRLNRSPGYITLAIARAAVQVRKKLADWAPPSYAARVDGAPRKRGRPRVTPFGKREDA